MKKNDWTHFDDFPENLTEAHGEGISFLLEQVAAGLSPFQTSLHDGLSPASRHTHILVELFTPYIVVVNTRNNREQSICWLFALTEGTDTAHKQVSTVFSQTINLNAIVTFFMPFFKWVITFIEETLDYFSISKVVTCL